MVKPMLGLAGRVLFKENYQEGPINLHRVRDAKFKEHNTGLTKTKAARVVKSPSNRPSLPPFSKYIDALIK